MLREYIQYKQFCEIAWFYELAGGISSSWGMKL